MNVVSSLVLTAAAVTALPVAANADVVQRFIVTSSVATDAGVLTQHRLLTLRGDGASATFEIDGESGSGAVQPAALSSSGQIEAPVNDQSLACYNMAEGVLDLARTHAVAPVFVAIGNGVVTIPIVVRTIERDGRLALMHAGGATQVSFSPPDAPAYDITVVVDAAVRSEGGILEGAAFSELTTTADGTRVVANSTCTLERATEEKRA